MSGSTIAKLGQKLCASFSDVNLARSPSLYAGVQQVNIALDSKQQPKV
ncbi:MAG: hypothetical protein VX740_11205 [Pseudomonadota bacterium]|nr:hypothetical protein [Alphaproteobacteria bacterium]MEC7703256.1 hypothetical protein [Pseudomonadota bacterium]MEC9235136.1 hypothetical protein [Pseudomonadota bacterium]MED5423996.1 hypothetical protein [Pseudomonadota bacterium]MEE3322363.1 hypothetical protein [Pseudomonadota bacterium]|tara:strand:+ start:10295 stop:10438 length:144 start_codon:yes stop_codon:yes gene_type:complete